MTDDWFARHRAMLDLAIDALSARDGFQPYGSSAGDYPDWAEAQGRLAFEACCNAHFHIDQPSTADRVGEENSPYRGHLNILYPGINVDQMLTASTRAGASWSRVDFRARAAVCLEALDRLRMRIFELAYAVMHTTGASFDVSFRIGGIEALARGLEAVALAYREQAWLVGHGAFDSSGGPAEARLQMRGRGVGLIIGCGAMPTWTGLAALFANVATGNAVVVKPHPRAILPWAITVAVLRETLADAGFEGDLVSVAAEDSSTSLAAVLASRNEIRLIDFTGSVGFARWLGEHASHARQWRFASATNVVIVESLDEPERFFDELVRSTFVFAGRLCTAPRVLLIPRPGVLVQAEVTDTDTFLGRLARQFERGPEGDPVGMLGAALPGEFDAIHSGAAECGEVLVRSRVMASDDFPGATACAPAVVRLDAASGRAFHREWFGPLLAVIEVDDVAEAVAWAQKTAREEGMIRAQVWSVDMGIRATAFEALATLGVDVVRAATGWNDVPAAFRDLHGSGMNSSASATLGSAEFVIGRFHAVRPAADE